MRKIPSELREDMANDPFYTKCALQGILGTCTGRIEWHHNLINAGRQVNEKWCILPLCHSHHEMARNKYVKEKLDWIMLNRADNSQLSPFCKAIDYISLKDRLNRIHG